MRNVSDNMQIEYWLWRAGSATATSTVRRHFLLNTILPEQLHLHLQVVMHAAHLSSMLSDLMPGSASRMSGALGCSRAGAWQEGRHTAAYMVSTSQRRAGDVSTSTFGCFAKADCVLTRMHEVVALTDGTCIRITAAHDTIMLLREGQLTTAACLGPHLGWQCCEPAWR